MSEGPRCPKCSSPNIRWVTLRQTVCVDVLQCQACGTALAEEDWTAPLLAMRSGRCMNCGDVRRRGVCNGCGLDQHEDAQVHDELRQVINSRAGFLANAREAAHQGRRLLALKLATAAAAFNEDGQGEAARGLRVWLLGAIGEVNAATEDAKAWIEESPDPSAVAWAGLAQQYQNAGFPGSAADAFGKALAKDPSQHTIRARRASLLMGMRREGQASEEAMLVLENPASPAEAIDIALTVAVQLCDLYESQLRDDEIELIAQRCGPHVERSAKMLTHRARVAAVKGDIPSAKRDLRAARAMEPENPTYDKIDILVKPQQKSWWRW